MSEDETFRILRRRPIRDVMIAMARSDNYEQTLREMGWSHEEYQPMREAYREKAYEDWWIEHNSRAQTIDTV